MAKRRQPSLIYTEWERLVFGQRLPDGTFPPEVEGSWRTLWQNHIATDEFLNTDVDDAALLCGLGWDLAIQHRDWASGLHRLERWFEHPEVERADLITTTTFRSWLGVGRLGRGDVNEALSMFHALTEESPARVRRIALYLVRNHLWAYCQEQAADEITPPELARLVIHVAVQFRGAKRSGRGREAGAATYGHLTAILHHTYPG